MVIWFRLSGHNESLYICDYLRIKMSIRAAIVSNTRIKNIGKHMTDCGRFECTIFTPWLFGFACLFLIILFQRLSTFFRSSLLAFANSYHSQLFPIPIYYSESRTHMRNGPLPWPPRTKKCYKNMKLLHIHTHPHTHIHTCRYYFHRLIIDKRVPLWFLLNRAITDLTPSNCIKRPNHIPNEKTYFIVVSPNKQNNGRSTSSFMLPPLK